MLTAAFLSIFPAKGKHVTTMTAPVSTYVGNGLKAMGDTMVNLVLVSFLKKEWSIVNQR